MKKGTRDWTGDKKKRTDQEEDFVLQIPSKELLPSSLLHPCQKLFLFMVCLLSSFLFRSLFRIPTRTDDLACLSSFLLSSFTLFSFISMAHHLEERRLLKQLMSVKCSIFASKNSDLLLMRRQETRDERRDGDHEGDATRKMMDRNSYSTSRGEKSADIKNQKKGPFSPVLGIHQMIFRIKRQKKQQQQQMPWHECDLSKKRWVTRQSSFDWLKEEEERQERHIFHR